MSTKMMFSPESARDRKEFNTLFGGSLMMCTSRGKALHVDPWNNIIVGSILRNVNPKNELSDDDIETILQVSGYYDKEHNLWIGQGACERLPELVVDAIAPYITPQTYVSLKMCNIRQMLGSAERFFQLVCNNNLKKERIPQAEVFKVYLEWCEVVQLPPESKKVFNQTLEEHGYSPKKGYVNKRCGITYLEIALRMEEGAWNVQSERQATQARQEEADAAEQIRHEYRAGEKVSGESDGGTEDALPLDETQSDPGTSGIGISGNLGASYTKALQDGLNPEDGAGGTFADADTRIESIQDAGLHSVAEGTGTGTIEVDHSTRVKSKIKGLPGTVRKFFKLMKVTYLVNPEHFTFDDFEEYYNTSGFASMQKDKLIELYDLFVEYAKLK